VAATRIKMKIAELENQIKKEMIALGGMVYATHTGDPTDSDTMHAALERIDALKAEVRAKERALGRLKGMRSCPACGAVGKIDHLYCAECGRLYEAED